MHHAPSWLILSKDVVLQRLIADVPFFATGILAFAVALLLLMKKRVNIMTSMIMLSAVFSFIAALLDLVILVEQSNLNNVTDSDSTSNSTTSSSPNSLNEGHVGVRVIIQMLLASALTLRFLFIWHYVGLPAREETPTPVTVFPSSSFLPTDADMHSGSWLQWGIFGIILKYFLLAAVVAVGVLESIWRLEQVFTPGIGASAVEAASGTLEVTLSILFLLKLLGNLLFTKTIRKKLFIGSIPLLMSMAISAGAGVGAVFVENFLDYPLGRFLQALEIYIMCQYVVYVAFDDVGLPGEPPAYRVDDDRKSTKARRVSAAESFSAVQVLSDDVLSPNPGGDVSRGGTVTLRAFRAQTGVDPTATPSDAAREKAKEALQSLDAGTLPGPGPSRRPSNKRLSSAEAIVAWVSKRISGRPVYKAEDFTFASGPSSTGATVAPSDESANGAKSVPRSLSPPSMANRKTLSTMGTESFYSIYADEDGTLLAGALNAPVNAPRRSTALNASAESLKGIPAVPTIPASAVPYSPIYGLNGPIRPPPIPIPTPVPVSVPRRPVSTVRPSRPPPVTVGTASGAALSQLSASQSNFPTTRPPVNATTTVDDDNNSAKARLLKAIEEVPATLNPQTPFSPQGDVNASKSTLSTPRSASVGSPFSLGRFPLPPSSPTFSPGFQPSTPDVVQDVKGKGKAKQEDEMAIPDSPTLRSARLSSGSEDAAIEAEFEIIPPRKSELLLRQQSFPSTMRASGSVMGLGLPASQETANGSDSPMGLPYEFQGREITSFIGNGAASAAKDIADARAISRILTGPGILSGPGIPSPLSPSNRLLPEGKSQAARKSSRLAGPPMTSSPTESRKSPTGLVITLPANPRPVRSSQSPDQAVGPRRLPSARAQ